MFLTKSKNMILHSAYKCINNANILHIDKISRAAGIPCLRVSGSIFHNIGSILPNENEAHKFLQVFFYSHSEEDINIRDLNSDEKQLMLRVRQEIVNVNPFIRTLTDIIDITGALSAVPSIPNFKIILSDDPTQGAHRGRYNRPTCAEVSAIVLGNEDSPIATSRNVIIHSKNNYPSKIPVFHSSYDPLAYVLTHMLLEMLII
jgi:hypothetical protein